MDPRNHASPRSLSWLEGPRLAKLVHRSILEESTLDRLRAKMLAVFGILLASVGPLVASGYFRKGEHLYGAAFLFCTALGLGTFLSIRFVGSTRMSSHLGSLAMWSAAVTGTYALGGTSSIAARWFAVIPVLAAVFGGGKLGLRWFVISWLTFATLTFAPEFGIALPEASVVGADRVHQVVTMTTFMIVLGGLFGVSEMLRIWLVRERETMRSLEQAQEKLVQSEKMASLGLLASGIAHEIKNPLNFVNNFSELAIEFIEEIDESREAGKEVTVEMLESTLKDVADNLARICEHGRRADAILNAMLMHARDHHGEPSSVDFNALVTEHVNIAYQGFRATNPDFSMAIEVDLEAGIEMVMLPYKEVAKVIINLVSNACYAMQERGRSGQERVYKPHLLVRTSRHEEGIELIIGDNGTGMSAEVRRRIFDPFYTTRPPGEGTGLGLSLSYEAIVNELGGALEVRTTMGAGAEFTVRVPIEDGAGTPAVGDGLPRSLAGDPGSL